MNNSQTIRIGGWLILAASLMLPAAGCESSRKQQQEQHDAARLVTVDVPADGESAEASATVAIGQMLVVRLPTQSGNGYSWRLVSGSAADSVLGLAQFRVEQEMTREGKPLPGGRAWDTFAFPASRQGATILDFVYDRPWEHKVAPARRYKVSVNVLQ